LFNARATGKRAGWDDSLSVSGSQLRPLWSGKHKRREKRAQNSVKNHARTNRVAISNGSQMTMTRRDQ